MARTQTMVQLNDELVRLLDDQADRRGMSRSALIREVLMEHLARDVEAEIDRRIVDGYRRIPPGTPDGWGDLTAATERSTRDVLAKLDAEEREAGYEPWMRKKGGRGRSG